MSTQPGPPAQAIASENDCFTVSGVDGALSLAYECLRDFHSIVTQEQTVKRGEFRGIPPVGVSDQRGPVMH